MLCGLWITRLLGNGWIMNALRGVVGRKVSQVAQNEAFVPESTTWKQPPTLEAQTPTIRPQSPIQRPSSPIRKPPTGPMLNPSISGTRRPITRSRADSTIRSRQPGPSFGRPPQPPPSNPKPSTPVLPTSRSRPPSASFDRPPLIQTLPTNPPQRSPSPARRRLEAPIPYYQVSTPPGPDQGFADRIAKKMLHEPGRGRTSGSPHRTPSTSPQRPATRTKPFPRMEASLFLVDLPRSPKFVRNLFAYRRTLVGLRNGKCF
ncbi:hypothetical protein BC829DRAFT_291479 [Chytridium lagenaria]|nr:hypothetical protein BC829DRAFT_291479 [Chytridium lagenaria]